MYYIPKHKIFDEHAGYFYLDNIVNEKNLWIGRKKVVNGKFFILKKQERINGFRFSIKKGPAGLAIYQFYPLKCGQKKKNETKIKIMIFKQIKLVLSVQRQ